MRLGVHVGVHADADRSLHAQLERHFVEHVDLGLALDVEAADAGLQRLAHFGARLAHAREDDLARIAAGGQHALQFTARDDVEAAALGGGRANSCSTASEELAFIA